MAEIPDDIPDDIPVDIPEGSTAQPELSEQPEQPTVLPPVAHQVRTTSYGTGTKDMKPGRRRLMYVLAGGAWIMYYIVKFGLQVAF